MQRLNSFDRNFTRQATVLLDTIQEIVLLNSSQVDAFTDTITHSQKIFTER